jgi:hypothetical protein
MNEKVCLNCVYFCKYYNPYQLSLGEKERVDVWNNSFEFAKSYALGCHRGIWDEGIEVMLKNERHKLKHRTCKYFYHYKKAGNKTRQACIEEEKEKKQHRQYIILALIGLSGILVTFLRGCN